MKLIGSKLRKRRDDLGLTQKQIADRIKVHPLTIGRMEEGAHSVNVVTLIACCRLLDIDLDELLADTELGSVEPIQEIIREPRSSEILEAVKNALKIAENPLIQRILQCSKEEQHELEGRLAMLEHRRDKNAKKDKPAKISKNSE